jgi:hypothetical protein
LIFLRALWQPHFFYPECFHSLARSLQKHPGGGGTLLQRLRPITHGMNLGGKSVIFVGRGFSRDISPAESMRPLGSD